VKNIYLISVTPVHTVSSITSHKTKSCNTVK